MSDTKLSHPFQTRFERYGATTFLYVAGEFDLGWVREFDATFDSVCAERPGCIVLDLSDLNFVDSSGLDGFLRAWQRANEEGFELAIVPSTNEHVRHILHVSGLDRLLPLVRDAP